MDLIKWFEVTDKKHLLAFNEFQISGSWPEDFLPEDIEIQSNWYSYLLKKISDQYLKEKLIEYHQVQMKKCFKKLVKKSITVSEEDKYKKEYKEAWQDVMKIINKYQ